MPDYNGFIHLEDGTRTSFTWEEACCNHCGRLPEDKQAVVNAARMMEKIRELLGNKPIFVSSWYRCPVYNARIGGASDSQHMKGRAVDFTTKGLSPRQVQARLRRHFGEGKLIRGLGRYAGFTHADNRPGDVATWNG